MSICGSQSPSTEHVSNRTKAIYQLSRVSSLTSEGQTSLPAGEPPPPLLLVLPPSLCASACLICVYGHVLNTQSARGWTDVAGAEPVFEPQPSLPDGIMNWKCGNLIGAGAFGRVYMGMNNDNGKLMAVKQVELLPMHVQHCTAGCMSKQWASSASNCKGSVSIYKGQLPIRWQGH